MSGCVNQIEKILVAVVGVVDNANGARLYSYSALAFKLHVVEKLSLHIARRNGVGLFQNTVGKSAFAVIDMRDNAEISDFILRKRHFHPPVRCFDKKIIAYRADFNKDF